MAGPNARSRGIFLLLLVASTACVTARGQAPAATDEKMSEFDVVSIKPNNSGRDGGVWGAGGDSYTARNTPLGRIILQAYFGQMSPAADRLKNAPAWVMSDPYDITAKVDAATADSWKGLNQAKKVALAAPLLRTMLEERCKLTARTVPTEIQGYALTIGKHGIKMKEAQPGEPVPERVARFEGGWMMVPFAPGDAKQTATYLQVTMAQFTAFLSLGGDPIVDQTGLTGKYDFEIPILAPPAPEAGESAAPALRVDAAHHFDWAAIGLELKPIKVPALDLVIDHIERPTAN